MTAFAVRYATASDLDAYVRILADGDATMRRHGNGRWEADDISLARAAGWIEAGEALIAESDGPVAVILLQWRDLVFWPDHDDGAAGYLHKLAVRRDMAGRGAPAALMAWAAEETRRRGRFLLRFDTGPWPRLCAAYERLGFTEFDRIVVNGRPSVRFQRVLA